MPRSLLSLAVSALAFAPAVLSAQNFDSSGNALLQGNYFVRQVLFSSVSQAGVIGRARSLTGTIVFDGAGRYTFNGQSFDSANGSGSPSSFSLNGTYAVTSSGLLQMDNPLDTAQTLSGGVGISAFVGSSTESNDFDMLIGIPAARNSSNASLQGAYRVGTLEFPRGDVNFVRNASFLLAANGAGSLSPLTVTGHAADAGGNGEFSQTISGASYSLGSQGSGTLSFPGNASSQLVAGVKALYVSSDGSVILGGSLTGFDMLVGIRAFQGTANNSSFQGIYYTAGVFDDISMLAQGSTFLSASYGSINANGLGTALSAERLNPSDVTQYDYTFDTEFNIASDASVTVTSSRFDVGAGGRTVLLTGRSALYSLQFGVQAVTLPRAGSVYLNPLGVVNAASYAPITNSIAGGELLRLYGENLSPVTLAAPRVPLPTNLGGVEVRINGRLSPLYIVSPGQIVLVVPFATSETYAYIQVNNNGTNSNAVMVYTNHSSPGMFTIGANGIGPGIFVHADFSLVTPSRPARIGETVIAFATGLGAVDPPVADGSVGPGGPFSTTPNVTVLIDGVDAPVSFAGLAPGFVGLYQINVQVPANVNPGDVYFDIHAPGATTSQATISVSR